MSTPKYWLLGSLTLIISLPGWAQRTDIQKLMTPKGTDRALLIEKNNLIRLWPLNSISKSTGSLNIDDLVTSRNGTGNSAVSRSVGVSAHSCGSRTYAYFENGAIISDETAEIEGLLSDSLVGNSARMIEYRGNRKAAYTTTKAGVGVALLDPYKQLHSPELIGLIEKQEIQKSVYRSTSLVQISNQNRRQRLEVQPSNYTLGGWFKPSYGKGDISLFKKYFVNSKTREKFVEWEIFAGGNKIWLHNYHDYEISAENNYLSEEEARHFREKNKKFYALNEYYSHVIEKKEVYQQFILPKGEPKKIVKIFVDTPIAYKNSKAIIEPVPTAPPLNPPVIVNPIPVIAYPPGLEIPRAPYTTNPIILGYGGTGKDYTVGFDFKTFWWGSNSNLGGCWGCLKGGVDHDVWHFFAVSVHLDDSLGPYVDLMVIRDPNEAKFHDKATLSSHFKTHRYELDRDLMSRPLKTPVTHGFFSEQNCVGKKYCTKSELEIGGLSTNRPYNGFMRGIFISKTALPQANIIELAAEYNPLDSEVCTYLKPN